MSESTFYCFGVPVAEERADGLLHGVEMSPEDRSRVEERLEKSG